MMSLGGAAAPGAAAAATNATAGEQKIKTVMDAKEIMLDYGEQQQQQQQQEMMAATAFTARGSICGSSILKWRSTAQKG